MADDDDVIPTRDVILTCHTEECVNAGIPIPLTVPEDTSSAVCGVCGQEITDITEGTDMTETTPTPEPETPDPETPETPEPETEDGDEKE